jgi:hypothetical protein
MVSANVASRVAARGAADHRAPVRAAVDPRRETAVIIPRDYHRSVAYEGTLEITRARDLRFQCDKAPHRSAEDPHLLQIVELLRAVDLIRNAGAVRAREVDQFLCLPSIGSRPLDLVHSVLRPLMPPLRSTQSTYFAFTGISITATALQGCATDTVDQTHRIVRRPIPTPSHADRARQSRPHRNGFHDGGNEHGVVLVALPFTRRS